MPLGVEEMKRGNLLILRNSQENVSPRRGNEEGGVNEAAGPMRSISSGTGEDLQEVAVVKRDLSIDDVAKNGIAKKFDHRIFKDRGKKPENRDRKNGFLSEFQKILVD